MKFYDIKIARGHWVTVQAESMHVVNSFCEKNGYTDWVVRGMMSRAEIEFSRIYCPKITAESGKL